VVATLTTLRPFVLILAFISAIGQGVAFGQYESESDATVPLENFYIKRHKGGVLRQLLSKVTFGFSTGYTGTSFKHDLTGFGILQAPGTAPVIFSANSRRYGNWVNDLVPDSTNSTGFMVDSDTTALGFKSKTFGIPFKATIHFQINRFRIGGGYSFDYTNVGKFRPLSYGGDINSFQLDKKGFFMKHYFVLVGAEVYRYYEYLLVVDMNIGGYKLGNQFNQGLIDRSLYVNFGATVEREMSEYFRLFVRPSYEIKNYNLAIPEVGQAITHRMNAFNLNFGATYRIPELARCFHPQCHAQINHAHGDKEYRSRRHPIYKKQNPHYGENYPTLIKYKGKNKNKLNPY
jgi:hypothetical protein